MTQVAPPSSRTRLGSVLWIGGMIGAASVLPVLPQLLANLSSEELTIPMVAIQAISLVQSGILIAIAVLVGLFLAHRVGLSAPLTEALVSRRTTSGAFRRHLLPGIAAGVFGGLAISLFSWIMLPSLPPEFVAAGKKLSIPLATRLLYGGVTEEILIRWGLMTLLVWLPYRFIGKSQGEVSVHYYLAAIFISAVIFGLGHLPVAKLLSPTVTPQLVIFILVGNTLFGLIAGLLYWRRGLESAIVAHMCCHLVMVSAERLAG